MFVYEFLTLMMRLVVLHAGREQQQVEAFPVGIVGGPLVQLPRRLTTSYIIKYCTVETRYKEVPKEWQTL